jgi:hypothetical protein
LLGALFLFGASAARAADTLPNRIEDRDFWNLIDALSEPNGSFQSENLLSNEIDFPRIMPIVKRTVKPDGVYFGVGPEQNFNYIAAIQPKIAFIIDIRRQNMLEHVLYKAIFDLSPNRAVFISRLFSRKQPSALTDNLTAAELFDAYSDLPADETVFRKNFKEIEHLLTVTHGFGLTSEDRAFMQRIYKAFFEFGPLIDYSSQGGGPSGGAFRPSYARLMTETDDTGREWSYLENETNYAVVRDLEARNLIIPLTGDFGGPKAIRAVGRYVRDHSAVVSAFYTSNVEGYLFQGGDRVGNSNGGAARFYENAASLPLDAASTFIRWIPGAAYRSGSEPSIVLEPIQRTIEDFRSGRLTGFDLLRRGRIVSGALSDLRRFPPGRNSGARTTPLIFDWSVYAWIGFHLLVASMAFVVRFLWDPAVPRFARKHLSIAATPGNETAGNERFDLPVRLLHSFVWAIGGYGLAALFQIAISSNPAVHLNPIRLAINGAMIAVAAGIVLSIVVTLLLSYRRVITTLSMIPLLMLPVFGVQVASDINRGLDLRPPITKTTPVLRRWQEQQRPRLGGAYTTYHIEIDTTADSGTFPPQMQVSRRIYDSLIEGDNVPIVIGQGAIGMQWYRSVNGLSMND